MYARAQLLRSTSLTRLIGVTFGLALCAGCSSDQGGPLTGSCVLKEGASCTCSGGRLVGELRCISEDALYCDCPTFAAPVTPGADVGGFDEDMPNDLADMCRENGTDPCVKEAGPPCEELFETSPDTLPGWSARNIQPERAARNDASHVYHAPSGTLCMRGQGGDVWREADDFHFLSVRQEGDFDIKVHIESFQAGAMYSKIGLMFREGDDPSSPLVMLQRTASQGTGLLARAESGQGAVVGYANHLHFDPNWIRLIRQGEDFFGYASVDGAEWDAIGKMRVPAVGQGGDVGVALLNNTMDQKSYALARLSGLSLDAAPSLTSQDCPRSLDCVDVVELLHQDVVREEDGGDTDTSFLERFKGAQASSSTVKDDVLTLERALLQAQNKIAAEPDKYIVIDVDIANTSSPQVFDQTIGPLRNVHIIGHGIEVVAAEGLNGPLLTLDREVVLEGVTFKEVDTAIGIVAPSDVNADREAHGSSLWIHHNTFASCRETCIELGTEATATRFVTIDHNVFGGDLPSSSTQAIDAIRCGDGECDVVEEAPLRLSAHHNIFEPSIKERYLRTRGETIFYNNWVKQVMTFVLPMYSESVVLSRHNLYEADPETSTTPYSRSDARGVLDSGPTDLYTGVRSQTPHNNSSVDTFLYYPRFFTSIVIGKEALKSYLTDQAGAPSKRGQ